MPARNNSQPRSSDPCTFVIFGAAGDLTKRKLLPALYHLAESNLLADDFCIIGVARRPFTNEIWRQQVVEYLKEFGPANRDPALLNWFIQRLYFLEGDLKDQECFAKLSEMLAQVDSQYNTRGNHIYYLSTPPDAFALVCEQLDKVGLTEEREGYWRRLVVEKPFGHDLKSALALTGQLLTAFTESQLYRIDHYLGKETVQNIMVFRFADGLFEPVWNHNYIDNIQITVAETVGVEGRGGYYDTSGALRDMVPNHMFQVLALTAMEPPARYEAEIVRDGKRDVFRAVRPFTDEDLATSVVRGQYSAGIVNGKSVPSYRSERSVPPDSRTETYVAMKLFIDNARWKDVPFYLRTGKCLPKRTSEVAICFKRQTLTRFDDLAQENLSPNTLIVRLQPDDGINLRFGAKVPGPLMKMDMVEMNFCYQDYFGAQGAGGYETLLYDVMIGDHMLFTRADNVESSWTLVDPILSSWSAAPTQTLHSYPAGTWGPSAADAMLAHDKRSWRPIPQACCPEIVY